MNLVDITVVIKTTHQQYMNLISSAFIVFPNVKSYPQFGQVRKKMVELHINKAPVCCNRFGGSSKKDQTGLFLF